MKRRVILAGSLQRTTAHRYVDEAPLGFVVTFNEPTKRRIQEEKYHAQIGDIAAQTTYIGRKWIPLHMKRILIDEFAEAMRLAGTPLHHDSQIIPSENGKRVIQLEIHSSDFYVGEASEFIAFLNAWGDDRDVLWTEPLQQEPA